MIVGLVVMAGTAIVSLFMLVIWLAMPLLPLVGIFLVTRVGIPWDSVGLPWN